MAYIDADEVIGYETDEGNLCSDCFKEMQHMVSEISVITPRIADELGELIICDNCANIIWGIDTAQPY